MNSRFPYLISFFALILLSTQSFSQVGINTVTPDPSAALDIVSNTKGLLAPRMSTSERLDIVNVVSPDPVAEGLLVFDTDLDAFYFYDSTISDWRKLITDSVERDNYVLVKSEADLPTPSGGVITLDMDTLYEINGTIVLTNSIDINDAYIFGQDSNEDVLALGVGGAIFESALGGTIKGLTLSASGGAIFDLSGSGAETLVFRDCIVANSASVGSISDFGTVFFSIIQFAGNTTGITYSDISSLLLSNVGWFDNNGGTFETYTGTFDLIEKVSGFSSVPSLATGIDVSSDPMVAIGVINSTTFSGAGTYINGYTTGTYTGYNFTNNWDINCPGIPLESDTSATGYYYMDPTNTTTVPFVTANVAVKVTGATFSKGLFRMSSTDNKLVYEGKEAREFQINCSGALDHGTTATPNGRIYDFFLYKTPNGGSPAEEVGIASERRFSNNDIGNFSMVGLINLAPGDAIEIYVSINNANNTNTYFTSLNVVLK